MENLIVIGIVAAIVLTATMYVIKEKKSGKKCIGCSCSGDGAGHTCSCGGSCSQGGNCHCHS